MKPKRIAIAVAQMKFRATIAENVSWIIQVILSSAKAGADVILFPECAVTGYNCDFAKVSPTEIGKALQAVASAARVARCYVLLGSPTFKGSERFNSLVVFDQRGHQIFCYSKIHLTARDNRFFTPGNALAFFRLGGVPCTAIICHERRYPELVRLQVATPARYRLQQLIFRHG